MNRYERLIEIEKLEKHCIDINCKELNRKDNIIDCRNCFIRLQINDLKNNKT